MKQIAKLDFIFSCPFFQIIITPLPALGNHLQNPWNDSASNGTKRHTKQPTSTEPFHFTESFPLRIGGATDAHALERMASKTYSCCQPRRWNHTAQSTRTIVRCEMLDLFLLILEIDNPTFNRLWFFRASGTARVPPEIDQHVCVATKGASFQTRRDTSKNFPSREVF